MAFDYSSSFAGINNAIGTLGKRFEQDRRRQTLAELGQDIQSGNYAGAAQKAFAAGDAETGISLAKLGQGRLDQQADATLLNGLFGSGAPAPAAPAAATPAANIGNPNEIETRFLDTVRGAGLTNPIGLAAVAATGKAESGYSPQNVNRVWNDPSQSGQPGQAGGIMSWRADRLQNLQRFAQQRGEQQPSVETQALFLAQEDPNLIPRLNAAKTPQEASQIMANAWRFAGYDQPGGEAARRAALTQQYASRFGGQGGGVPSPSAVVAGGPLPPPGVQVAETDEDVRRLEGSLPPSNQFAQADAPAPGAAQTQFVIPGTNAVVDQETLSSNPKILALTRGMALAKTETARNAIKAKLDLEIADAKQRMAVNTPTDVQRNYEIARRQGYQGSLLDYQKELRQSTTVNVDTKGEGKFEEEFGKSQAKRWDGYIAEGDTAQARLADIQTLRETSRRLGSQGSSANLKSTIGPYAESLGIQIEGLPDIQLYESITNRLAPNLRAPGSGSTSDIEFKGFQRAIGPLSNNPAAREMILDTFEAASRNDVARAEIAGRLATKEITRAQAEKELRALPNPLEGFRKFREANPDLVGQAIKETGMRSLASKRAPVKVTSPDEARKLPSGTPIILPDGSPGVVP